MKLLTTRPGVGPGRKLTTRIVALGAVALLALSACQVVGGPLMRPAPQPEPKAAPAASKAVLAPEESAYPGAKLEADLRKGPVGSQVTFSGSGFPSGLPVVLTWKTFDGRWVLEQEEVVFVGPKYDERLIALPETRADTNGAFRAHFTVPEDFGGSHDVVASVEGKFATKMAFTVTSSFSVSRTSGPVGTPIEVRATGLGYRTQESQWHVTWDNGFTGYMMGLTTHGSGTAKFRIAGTPGQHVLKIWRNYRGIPYLNPHQGPFGALPESTFVIDVLPGVYDGPAIWADPNPEQTVRPAPAPQSSGGASLTLSSPAGLVGSKLTIGGQGFPAGQPVELKWATRSGQKITPTGLLEGFEEAIEELPSATAGPDGRFNLELEVPNDYAGFHRIAATSGGATAEATYSIYANIAEFTQRARVGEDVKIRMKGVGWTIQGKTYAVVYDNVYLGYVCSFSTRGDIDLHLPAAGAPGAHTIDLYPAVYEGREPTPDIYSKPNLSYADNHPGGALPAFRLTLMVTE